MSSESDYNFNETAPAMSSGSTLHLPFALLCAALAVVLINQTANTFKQRTALREGKAQLIDAYKNREPLVKQSAELQKKLQDLVLDLMLLAKTDEEAKAIITKYNIQQNAPSGDAAAPAP